MDQTTMKHRVNAVHRAIVDSFVISMQASLLDVISNQRSEIKRLKADNADLDDAMQGILTDYAARCREVANLRIVLRAEAIERQQQMIEELEGFVANGIGAQYYQMPYDFVFESIDLCKPSNVK